MFPEAMTSPTISSVRARHFSQFRYATLLYIKLGGWIQSTKISTEEEKEEEEEVVVVVVVALDAKNILNKSQFE